MTPSWGDYFLDYVGAFGWNWSKAIRYADLHTGRESKNWLFYLWSGYSPIRRIKVRR